MNLLRSKVFFNIPFPRLHLVKIEGRIRCEFDIKKKNN